MLRHNICYFKSFIDIWAIDYILQWERHCHLRWLKWSPAVSCNESHLPNRRVTSQDSPALPCQHSCRVPSVSHRALCQLLIFRCWAFKQLHGSFTKMPPTEGNVGHFWKGCGSMWPTCHRPVSRHPPAPPAGALRSPWVWSLLSLAGWHPSQAETIVWVMLRLVHSMGKTDSSTKKQILTFEGCSCLKTPIEPQHTLWGWGIHSGTKWCLLFS